MAIINGAGLAHASGAGQPGIHAGPDGVLLPSRAACQKLVVVDPFRGYYKTKNTCHESLLSGRRYN